MAIKINLSNFTNFYGEDKFTELEPSLKTAHANLFSGEGKGSDFLGWVNLPTVSPIEEINHIKACAKKIIDQSDVLIVIGIGGSYLGARSAIEFLKSPNYNLLDRKGCPQVFFAGNNLSSDYVTELFEIIGDRDFSVNVISKSGTTTEPALAFHFFETKLKEKYPENWSERVYVTTDAKRGELRPFADKHACESFVISDDVGGRFSVLSPVGLLPIACTGVDIDKILAGAKAMQDELAVFSMENPAVKYAAARNLAYAGGKKVEILGCYQPKFRFMAEWWKQLFGESEGKGKKGIYPASVELPADLHSLGQYIQDGERMLFETIVSIGSTDADILIENCDKDFPKLEMFEGYALNTINNKVFEGTTKAHITGGVPNIAISVDDFHEFAYGEMVYFFEFACGISAYVLDVNPFDQPGVEEYKAEVMKLIQK